MHSPTLTQHFNATCPRHVSLSHVSHRSCRLSPTISINLTSFLHLRCLSSPCFSILFHIHSPFPNPKHTKMESKGGCCITKCQTHAAHHISKVHTIMLRFRPIAPKPLSAAALSDASSSESAADAFSRSAGPKRKRAKGNTNTNTKRCTRRRNAPPPPHPPPTPPPTTLPLLPETPVPKKTISGEGQKNAPVWLSFGDHGGAAASVDPYWFPPPAVAGTVVMMECVTDTWREDDERLGSGDEERKVKLEADTCPGFISDGYGRVTWTNGAYREVVGEGGVWLAMKVSVAYPCRGFTCWVRVQYACGTERTVPCDVWRMDSGGFAWRLDVQAALTLTLAL
ncbi:unnamed protein product [Sphenostylis stenocarpa]|uniref:DUF7950 domain-containing protein n=1 Tax=Sphenostylis stenocarpa TaxID=92480 RepID=A0AA86SY41_9FABA|nr:unnamed protein product [Sphenostylis stenocarpa]